MPQGCLDEKGSPIASEVNQSGGVAVILFQPLSFWSVCRPAFAQPAGPQYFTFLQLNLWNNFGNRCESDCVHGVETPREPPGRFLPLLLGCRASPHLLRSAAHSCQEPVKLTHQIIMSDRRHSNKRSICCCFFFFLVHSFVNGLRLSSGD